MDKLIIIGNGFDIAHGLKTDYKYFLSQLTEQHRKFYETVTSYKAASKAWRWRETQMMV